MTLSKLCIFGDSWGCGTWSLPNGEFLLGTNGDNYFAKTFETYFDCVENYSKGGASNSDIIKQIKDVLELDATPIVLVIQTDPIRDVLPFLSKGSVAASDYRHILKTDYQSFNNMLLEFYYLNLNNIAKKFNLTINISGGCSDIDCNIIKKYKNLNVVCESFYKLLEPTYKTNSVSSTHNILDGVRTFSTKNLRLVNNIRKKSKIQKQYQEKYFGYNGDNHPSKNGIDLWTSYIYKNLTICNKGTIINT